MINDILDISKIEAGKMELDFQEVKLQDLILNVIRTAWVLVKGKPVELHHEIPPDLPLIQADPVRVQQVLLNLLSNAAKFTEEGSIIISAELRVSGDGYSEVVISVADTGCGISPSHQKKLFKPFTQLNTSSLQKMKGTGLGLSISRRLVEMHGGWIGFESEPGEGSTFSFSLPVSRVVPPHADSMGDV
jgi:signal transduction histidine kinase